MVPRTFLDWKAWARPETVSPVWSPDVVGAALELVVPSYVLESLVALMSSARAVMSAVVEAVVLKV